MQLFQVGCDNSGKSSGRGWKKEGGFVQKAQVDVQARIR